MQKFENTLCSGKCLSEGYVRSGKRPSGKCPVGELSDRGSVRRGSVLGEVSVGELPSRETVLQS